MSAIAAPDRKESTEIELRSRSRESATEFHKLLVSLSAGSIIVYFYTLTIEVKPPLSSLQQITCLASLVLMAISVLGGILSWYADTHTNAIYAKYTASAGELQDTMYRSWSRVETLGTLLLALGFVLGILTSVGYVVLRIYLV